MSKKYGPYMEYEKPKVTKATEREIAEALSKILGIPVAYGIIESEV